MGCTSSASHGSAPPSDNAETSPREGPQELLSVNFKQLGASIQAKAAVACKLCGGQVTLGFYPVCRPNVENGEPEFTELTRLDQLMDTPMPNRPYGACSNCFCRIYISAAANTRVQEALRGHELFKLLFAPVEELGLSEPALKAIKALAPGYGINTVAQLVEDLVGSLHPLKQDEAVYQDILETLEAKGVILFASHYFGGRA